MSMRTVKFDEEAEATLAKLREETGLTIAEILKRGLTAYQQATVDRPSRTAYEVWKSLDWGEGDSALPAAKDSKQAIKEILRKKQESNSR